MQPLSLETTIQENTTTYDKSYKTFQMQQALDQIKETSYPVSPTEADMIAMHQRQIEMLKKK